MLPKPAFSFTIPSVRDDIDLECRIYHPTKFKAGQSGCGTWTRKGAIIAHPYGPMGGCFDDPVVSLIASVFLKQNFIVGTFNFRGAGRSKGRTTWTAKAETDDYISIIGFLIHYLHSLVPPSVGSISSSDLLSPSLPLTPIKSAAVLEASQLEQDASQTTIILGGYSYGSLITMNLPTIESIVARFENATKGSAEAEIRLRAAHMSSQWNTEAREERGRSLTVEQGQSSLHSMVYGGEESEPGTRRKSRDSRRSVDIVRRSFDHSRRGHNKGLQRSDDSFSGSSAGHLESSTVLLPRTHILLVSPLLPPISSLIMMFSGVSSLFKGATPAIDIHYLSRRHTFVIYGGRDFFTSSRKLNDWSSHLSELQASQYRYHEVSHAGHFWREDGVATELKQKIKDWILDLECL